ncbi:glycosyltransferase [Butyrivibrio sp. YAB3001]|uniref:glycosyltransferase n=1 Tax=Butyrivibrio sp. YAB3001 TaxID=1520812 RepID=UPI0008F67DC0|nr:glycosyltransferase [Butyrivibrio sp. YAB3001]SFC75071.1 Glycosyltransferase involved in cell wall bisynthesis [Butyrivibrio sp. YAB3001]
MKVAVYFDDVSPEKGGASSLLMTIEDELKKLKGKYDIVICYNGGSGHPYKTKKDDFEYINVDKVRLNNLFKMFCLNTKNSVRNAMLRFFYHNERLYRESYLDYLAEKEGIDIYWFTYPANVDLTTPFIYSLWDLGHRILPSFPDTTKPAYRWKGLDEQYSRLLGKASYILTGNETGKKEILENYNVMADKIRIVPFPVTFFCYGPEEKPKLELPDKYFFYPAQFWPHKNHICIIEALELLRKENGIDAHVLFTGSDKGNKQYVADMAKEHGVDDLVHFGGFVTYEEMKYIYTHAEGMIFASVSGPNNIPPIEAVYLECPLIISDIPGHQEQMGEGIMYFNGYKPSELAAHMKKLLSDPSEKKAVIVRQQSIRNEIVNYSYSEQMAKILDEFKVICKRWKKV